MNIVFKNKGIMSLVDITTMGDSSKRDDPSKIGEFDSGLKYAIAILYRNGISVTIFSGGKEYTFDTTVISPDHKAKEVLTVNGNPTAFSPQLGHNWELWMAYRELYSNCIDEDGSVMFSEEEFKEDILSDDTIIIIHSCDFNQEMFHNWGKYFVDKQKPIYEDSSVKMYKNNSEDNHIRLYKNGIMIYENVNTKSQFVYDYSHASIDERRILNDIYTFKNKISDLIMECVNTNIISEFVEHKIDKSFESKLDYYWSFSEQWVEFINSYHLETPITDKIVYRSMFVKMIEDNRFDIGYRSVSRSPSVYSSQVLVKPIPEKGESEEESFEDKIKSICKPFEVNYSIVKSNIDGLKCLPDKAKKVLYVTEDFSEDDLWELVKAVFRIDSNDNPNHVYRKYAELLKQ